MLYWMCEKSEGRPLSWPQLEYSIRRNFGGLETPKMKPLDIFRDYLKFGDEILDNDGIPEHVKLILQ